MATISITIPDTAINEVRDAFATIYNWDASSGLTKTQFAKAVVAEYVKGIYREYKARQAGDAARIVADGVDIN